MTSRLAVVRSCTKCPHALVSFATATYDTWMCTSRGDRVLPASAHGDGRRKCRIPAWCPLPKAPKPRRKP